MKLPKLAIFDMDGLLFDTERLFMRLKGVNMAKYGYSQTEEEYVRTLGLNGEALHKVLIDTYGEAYPADEISAQTRKDENEYLDKYGPSVKKGIPELLAFFKERGVPCCVATATQGYNARRYIERAGLTPYFAFIIGGDEIRHSKPDPEIFLACCKRQETAPEDALVFEDSENGILAAFNGHIPVICIPDMKYPAPEFAEKTACILNSADEMIGKFSD